MTASSDRSATDTLVVGFNPIEKYSRQFGSSPQERIILKRLKPPPSRVQKDFEAASITSHPTIIISYLFETILLIPTSQK